MDSIFFIFAGLAALVHVYIFILETFLWTKPIAMNTFGLTKEFAESTKELAANQGVYNGALAGVVFVGIGISVTGDGNVGNSIILAGVATMAIAAVYLFVSSPAKRAAAIKQLVFPLATIVAYAVLNLP